MHKFLRKSFFLCGTYRNDDDLKLWMCRTGDGTSRLRCFELKDICIYTYLTTGSLTKLQILVWRILASASVPFYKSEIFMEIIFPMWHFVWHLIVFGAGLPTKYNIYRVVPTPSQPADHRNGRTTRLRDYIDSTNSWPQKWANDKVEGLRRLYHGWPQKWAMTRLCDVISPEGY